MNLNRPVLWTLVALGCASAPALAALGGNTASVEADRAALRGSLHVVSASGYAVHEITTASGLKVHEYVSSAGKVFAITWAGNRTPDLQQMLGSSFGEFQQARAARPSNRDHRHLAVDTPTLIVRSVGHLRTYTGRAWLPAELPASFSLSSLN